MGSVYLLELADWCRSAGLPTHEDNGWQYRARSSGGFEPGRPWTVMWHHTASKTSPQNDVNYMVRGSEDAPVANLLLDRNGEVWVMAGGATNTNGKGGPIGMSKGTVPKDSMNTYAISIEAANDGVGEPWPQAQIDAYFALSLELTYRLGLLTSDVANHNTWAPDRKVDPARAEAVQGPWRPASANSSGTWRQDTVVNELWSRAALPPPDPGPDPGPQPPQPGPPGPPITVEDNVLVCALDQNGTAWVGNGIERTTIDSGDVFDRYKLVWRDGFRNTSNQVVTGWENVATVDGLVLATLGRPR